MSSTEYFTVPEAAALLRVSERTIYQLIRTGHLQSVKIGRSRRVTAENIAALHDDKAVMSR